MRIKLIHAIRKPPWLEVWTGMVSVAVTIALLLTFLPMHVTVNTDGLLSISLSQAQASPGWLSGYDHRIEITINGTADGNQTNYQMPAKIHKWLAWQFYSGNPVIAPSQSWETSGIYSTSVLTDNYGNPILDGSNNMSAYWGGINASGNDRIGGGTSSNGISWLKYVSNPVINIGAGGTWDDQHVNDPTIVKVGSTYYLWYTGAESDVPPLGGIGLANSTDGVTWTKYTNNPVMDHGYNAAEYLPVTPSVIYENSTYRMWYWGRLETTAAGNGIFYATSSDGINWTRQGQVISTTTYTDPCVKRLDENTLIMSVADKSGTYPYSAFLTSSDGLSWTVVDSGQVQIPNLTIAPYGDPINDIIRMNGTWWAYSAECTIPAGPTQIGVLKGIDYAATSVCPPRAEIGLNFSIAQDDWDDIRFTKSDGTTLLDYWTEQAISGQYAYVWAEFDSLPTGTNSTFYLYSGNADATSASNGTATFGTSPSFHDDFERGNNGDTVGGSWTEAAAHVHISTEQDIGDVAGFSGTRSMMLVSAATPAGATLACTGASTYAVYTRVYRDTNAGGTISGNIRHGNGIKRITIEIEDDGDIMYYDTGWKDTGYNCAWGAWETFGLRNINFSAGTYDICYNGVVIKSGAAMQTSSADTNIITLVSDTDSGQDIFYDNFILRKYTANEPTWASFGDKEEPAPEITNSPDSWDFGILAIGTTANTAINYFTLNNTGNCAVDITIQGTNLTGGDDTWELSSTATPGENIYGLLAGLDDADDLFDVVVNLTANAFVANLAEAVTQKWGLNLSMPSSLSGFDGNNITGTITLIASEHT